MSKKVVRKAVRKVAKKKRAKTTLSKTAKNKLVGIDKQIEKLKDNMPEWAKGLTWKQMIFCLAYGDVQSSVYGQKASAYVKAGYKDDVSKYTCANALISQPKIQSALDKYKVHRGKIGAIARPQVLDMALSQYWKADKKGDSMACLRAIELIARMAGLNQDKLIISPDRQALLDETQLIEQQRLTARLIEDHMDAEVVDTTATVVEEKSAMADKGDYWDKNEG